MASASDRRNEVLKAGFTSVDALRDSLQNLRRRRDRLLDKHLDVAMFGGGDFGNPAISEMERSEMNRRISRAGGLDVINQRITELERILAGMEG